MARPVSSYGDATPYFRSHAELLRESLERNELSVSLKPAPEPAFIGHMVRYVEDTNPPWYRSFFHEQEANRRDRTESSLERIISLEDAPSDEFPFASYHRRVRSMIYEHLANGYQSTEGFVPGNNAFREVVGLDRVVDGMYAPASESATYSVSEPGRATVEAPF